MRLVGGGRGRDGRARHAAQGIRARNSDGLLCPGGPLAARPPAPPTCAATAAWLLNRPSPSAAGPRAMILSGVMDQRQSIGLLESPTGEEITSHGQHLGKAGLHTGMALLNSTPVTASKKDGLEKEK
ncbi:hypothetical protein NDU88_009170 [Pleurodeles waltl]|uniref:Uncharacterized protein n=1 Tax=Pleurodeles waltl TaxID=8319 RepID=A0AAV7PRG5_PLEWA|nr:hypothetical protein NDU88_009170 [Pleurodeles waltl]